MRVVRNNSTACDALGRCLTCGEPVTSGGCQNLRCPDGPVKIIVMGETTVVGQLLVMDPADDSFTRLRGW